MLTAWGTSSERDLESGLFFTAILTMYSSRFVLLLSVHLTSLSLDRTLILYPRAPPNLVPWFR